LDHFMTLKPPKYIDRPPSNLVSKQNPSTLDHQVDHLFLLVGKNTLPNWVAVTTMLKAGGKAHLIHTDFTEPEAKNLQLALGRQPLPSNAQLINIGNNQGEAFAIRGQLQPIIQDLSGSVGLNYTGGTKSMSVHAYRTIEEFHPNAIFSYLDSNTSMMMIDNDRGVSRALKPNVSFETLFQLHSLVWRNNTPPTTSPIYAGAATALMKLYQNVSNAQGWRVWCEKTLKPDTQRISKGGHFTGWLDETQLRGTSPLRTDGLPPSLQEFANQYLDAKNGATTLSSIQKHGFRSLQQVCQWLDGIWIEHYTLAQIQQIASQTGSHESAISLNMTNPQHPNEDGHKFEFDAAFMCDYHLFAISCTTSSHRALCKSKLLEASVRAQQLGGSEARIALVCCNDEPESIKKELESDRPNRKIAVFGREDLPVLSEKILEWVKANA
jgi:hypothetical protein